MNLPNREGEVGYSILSVVVGCHIILAEQRDNRVSSYTGHGVAVISAEALSSSCCPTEGQAVP